MPAQLVPKQEANVAISLPARSIPWNERTDGNGTGVARRANGWTSNENGNVFLTTTVHMCSNYVTDSYHASALGIREDTGSTCKFLNHTSTVYMYLQPGQVVTQ
jgi:hypothetical protein